MTANSGTGAEDAALELLRQADDAIVAGVERELPGWAVRGVARILDAWGQLDAAARAQADREAEAAGDVARTLSLIHI